MDGTRNRATSAESQKQKKKMQKGDVKPFGGQSEYVGDHFPNKSEFQKFNPTLGNSKEDADGLKGDRASIALLMLLYVLQGIPLGIAGSVPYLLSSRHVSYKDQAIFSFVHWPFSVKLLWAPIVDSVFLPSFGRRKSWMVPTQYLLGLFMYLLSLTEAVAGLMDPKAASNIDVTLLASMFFALNFLAATQDIAVDGWALTMLSKRNVGWVATCNTVGQTAGYFAGNVVFLTLESAEFCNKYLRSEPQSQGLVTLSSYLQFWAVVFVVVTTLVMLLKHEDDYQKDTQDSIQNSVVEPVNYCRRPLNPSEGDAINGEPMVEIMPALSDGCQTVSDAYCQLFRLLRLPAVQSLIVTLLTIKIGFAAADSVTSLKLIEQGVPKEHLALLAIPMVAVDVVLPVVVTRVMSNRRPLSFVLKAMPFRLLLGLLFAFIVWWVPTTRLSDGSFPLHMYGALFISSALHQLAVYFMFVPLMAFYAKISDPAIGGTYMTLLNTISNLGGNWPATVALWLVEGLTWTGCGNGSLGCSANSQECSEPFTKCTILDGYYVESLACFVIGFVWLWVRSRKVRQLEDLPASHWTS